MPLLGTERLTVDDRRRLSRKNWSKQMLTSVEYWNSRGIITGRDRVKTNQPDERLTHLYSAEAGDLMSPVEPYCPDGWNNRNHDGFSVLRNLVGPRGICRRCIFFALTELAR